MGAIGRAARRTLANHLARMKAATRHALVIAYKADDGTAASSAEIHRLERRLADLDARLTRLDLSR
jgi:hypothetical protein